MWLVQRMKKVGQHVGLWLLLIGCVWGLWTGGKVAVAVGDVRIVNQEVAVLPTDEQRLQFIVVMTVENRGDAPEPELYVALPHEAEGFTPVGDGWVSLSRSTVVWSKKAALPPGSGERWPIRF